MGIFGHTARMANRIREWRDKRGLSRRELAELVGCGETYITKLEREERQLKQQWMERIARALKITPADLLPAQQNINGALTKLVYAPLISWTSASQFAESVGKQAYEADEWIPVMHSRDTVLALQVVGNSMAYQAPDGFVIVYDYEDVDLADNKLYVIEYEGETTFKKYRCSGGPPRFEPDTPEPGHETIYPQDGFRVLGRVVWIGRRV